MVKESLSHADYVSLHRFLAENKERYNRCNPAPLRVFVFSHACESWRERLDELRDLIEYADAVLVDSGIKIYSGWTNPNIVADTRRVVTHDTFALATVNTVSEVSLALRCKHWMASASMPREYTT